MNAVLLSLTITLVVVSTGFAASNSDTTLRSPEHANLKDITGAFGFGSAPEKQLTHAKSGLSTKWTAHDFSASPGYVSRLIAGLRRHGRRISMVRPRRTWHNSLRQKRLAFRQADTSDDDLEDDIEEGLDNVENAGEDAIDGIESALDDIGDDLDSDDDDDVCFPAGAKVNVQGKGIVGMSSLNVGDHVQVTSGEFSPVYTFSHRVPRGTFEFVQLVTARGTIRLTASHYIRADGVMMAASNVKTGSLLERGDGSRVVVESIKRVLAEGLYNPHTLSGDIVVDGFVASTFTRAVDPVAASALLTPVRAVFRVMGIDMAFGMMDQGASGGVLDMMPRGDRALTT